MRFGLDVIRADVKIVRSKPLAGEIEFKGTERTYQCWVQGNAVQLADVDHQA